MAVATRQRRISLAMRSLNSLILGRGMCRARGLATAAVCTTLAQPLTIQKDWSVARPGPGQVKLKVAAAGINFADLLQTRGQYQDVAEPPFVPGNEAAGEICEVGDGVDHLSVGDAVVCLSRGGAFASETTVDARTVLKLPSQAVSPDFAEAAALLCNYGTAHLALSQRAHLQPGETVLITAAAGGVGLAAVEVAKLMGAGRVIAACGSEDKISMAATKGAEAKGVVYSSPADARAFRGQLKEVLGKQGLDVIVDMVGGEILEPCVRSLSWNGRAVVVGFASGTIPKIPANVLLVKNISVSGLFWGAHLIHDPKAILGSAQTLLKWWSEGAIKPHVTARVPLEQVNEAFALIEGRQSTGKVVLIP